MSSEAPIQASERDHMLGAPRQRDGPGGFDDLIQPLVGRPSAG